MGWLALCRTRDSLPPPLATGRYMELREDTIVTRQNAMPRPSAYLSADGCATNSSLPPSAPLNGAIYIPKRPNQPSTHPYWWVSFKKLLLSVGCCSCSSSRWHPPSLRFKQPSLYSFLTCSTRLHICAQVVADCLQIEYMQRAVKIKTCKQIACTVGHNCRRHQLACKQ